MIRHACLYLIGEIKMKNITKNKIVLVTLGFLLGFSLLILTDSNKVDIQKESLPKTNALTQVLLHSYDFEGDTVGQDPSGVTLSVIEPAGSGTANVDNLGDVQQNHVAIHKDGGDQRVELRDNISYYGNTFDAGVFHCKIYHDDSLFGILFYDDLGVLFRLDWFDGIIGRWSPYEVYTTYNYNQWYDVVVYFNISLGWMFEIDGVRFGDGYAYAFEHGGSGGLEWIRWCSAFSGGGNGFFRVDDVEFYYYEEISTVGFFDDFESGILGAHGLILAILLRMQCGLVMNLQELLRRVFGNMGN